MLTWNKDGIHYEADQRHVEILVRELGLEGCKPVTTPGAREETGKAIIKDTADSDDVLLDGHGATMFRALAARANYLSQDRPDIQFAVKEVARRMSAPRAVDQQLLKRLGRYLAGSPRAQYKFHW